MSELRLAACGMNCKECDSYKVRTEHDVKAAKSLAAWYRGMGWIEKNEGAEAVILKNPLCKGCWNSTDDCFFKCGCHPKLDFRICCTDKKIQHCGECNDFPCAMYIEFVGDLEHHKRAMEHLISIRKNA